MNILRRPQTIANELRCQTLTERDKLNLFWLSLSLTGVTGTGSYLSIFLNPLSPISLTNLVFWGITIWGILQSYEANFRGDNRLFLERVICLSAALELRVLPIYWLFSLLYWQFIYKFIYIGGYIALLVYILAVGSLFCYLYIRLRSLISYVASPEDTFDVR